MEPTAKLEELVREIAFSEVMPRFLNGQSERKADGSMLSEADLASQAAFSERLPEIVDAPVLGEEMTYEQQLSLWRAHAQSGLWVVDPIDGTNNFVNGLPHFALSAALIRAGRAELGVVFDPCAGECFSAARGRGSHLNGVKLPLRRVKKRLHEALAGIDVKRLRSGRLVSSLNNFAPFGTLRCLGSSTLDWCYLAAGRFDIYMHGGQNLWDYAAGALIFEEAGGIYATLEGDGFWSGRHVFQRSVVAAGQEELFQKWLAWVRANQ